MRTLSALVATFCLAVLFALPGTASAAVCPLPTATGDPLPDFSPALDVTGTVDQSRAGGYLQIPFDVASNTTAIRVRYSYDQPGGVCGGPSTNTLDMGVYEPRDPGDAFWGTDESRGWSGSAVKDLAIARNGFSDEVTYNGARKALVPGTTTRAYRPGDIPAGTWAVELGLAFLGADTQYRVLVETTSSTDWSDDPYTPAGYSTAAANPAAGWYAGDFHVHGEQEPGNATMTQTFARAFDPPSAGGSGLDFVTLVDHNNNVAHDNLAGYQAANPGKLIIPGVEETSYRGHHNNQGKGPLTDFRGGPILAAPAPLGPTIDDDQLTKVRDASPPSAAFAEETAEGNWSQINHPAIFKGSPAACRGCAWGYDAAETDYPKVDAIEVQTGPAAIPFNAPAAPNPFIADTLAFYESALASGNHVAAVGSSDDHQGGGATGPFDAPVGSATTMVGADELSEQGVTAAVKAAHTYVKFFGNDGPEVSLTAPEPGGGDVTFGDTVHDPGAELTATVSGAASSGRPGSWSLVLLKDGAPAETVPFSGDSFTQTFTASGPGRYSLKVLRNQLGLDFTEVYTSPIWVEEGQSSNRFKVLDVKRNKRKGTAKVTVRVPAAGVMTASGSGIEKAKKSPKAAGKTKLKIEAGTKKLDRKLDRKGRATVKPKLRFVPEGGHAYAKKKKIELRLKPSA